MTKKTNSRDFDIITYQLGRAPRGDISVERRCMYGCPEVIKTPPWIEDQFFPTTYWLTCPTRVRKVSRLEDLGWVDRLENELATKKDWRIELKKSTQNQVMERRRLAAGKRASSDDQDKLNHGIGGVKNIASLKCLHAHLADFFVGGINPVGKKVANLIGEISCSKGCCL